MAGTTTYYGISYPTSTDYVKDGATAMQTIATGFDSAVAIPTYNNQTGTSYTFVLADTGKTVTSDNASAVTFTIPPQASVAWANNTTLTVRNLGAGVVTIAGGAGVTVTNTAQTVAQYGEVKLIRTASNAWTVVPASGGASALTLITAQSVGTGVSSITVSNCFSATYNSYKISYVGGTSSAAADIVMSLAGITSGYQANLIYSSFSGGGALAAGTNSGSSWPWLGLTNTSSIIFECNVINPFQSLPKYATGDLVNGVGGNAGIGRAYNASTTSAASFTIAPSSGTFTGGTICVYGYAKA